MICICKYSFYIGKILFYQGNTYSYDVNIHEQDFDNLKIVNKIYMVRNENEIVPFIELRFREKFDDRQEIRNEKINQILS